jgi:hypothetical protein
MSGPGGPLAGGVSAQGVLVNPAASSRRQVMVQATPPLPETGGPAPEKFPKTV